jgi:predicted RNA-binding protein (virulence factor B family)
MRASRSLLRRAAAIAPGSRHEGVVISVTKLGVSLELDWAEENGALAEVLVHSSNVFDDTIHIGKRMPVYVSSVREEDGKIDAMFSLPRSTLTLDRDSKQVKAAIDAHDGVLPLGDKSDPDDIREMLHMSKSSFKAAIGRLKKHKMVDISAHWVTAKSSTE